MVLFTITYIVFYCFSQVVFDSLIGRVCRVGVYEHGEIEFAMEALIRVLDSNGSWVHQELSYHKVENVIHNKIVEGIDKSFSGCISRWNFAVDTPIDKMHGYSHCCSLQVPQAIPQKLRGGVHNPD